MFTNNKISLAQVADSLGIEVIRDCNFSYAAKIPSRLDGRLVSCQKEYHLTELHANSGIVGVLSNKELASSVPKNLGLGICEKPYETLLQVHEMISGRQGFQWKDFRTEIDPTAYIHPSAVIPENNVRVGAYSRIGPNVVIAERSIIGSGCVIGPCSVIGAEAFEVNRFSSPIMILKQSGGVWIDDFVEITGGCTVVRATFGGFTRLGRETKLDCQVHVAHDCLIGNRVSIAACAEISGRVEIGDDTFVGPNVSISNGIKIGAGCHITIGSVVVKDVRDNERVTGNFAVSHQNWIRFIKSIR